MPTRAELERRLASAGERFEIERLERSLGRRAQVGDEENNEFSFTVWQLGEAFIVSTPAEPYSSFQINLRAAFPERAIIVLNLSDGTTTYLPQPEAFQRDVYQSRIALYEPDSLGVVSKAASAAIAALGGHDSSVGKHQPAMATRQKQIT